jgi:hypothetical protein
MRNGSMTVVLIAASCALAIGLPAATGAFAQTVDEAPRRLSSPKLPNALIAQFRADPQALLTTYASAGLPLSNRVLSLVLTDPSLVGPLLDLAKSANDAQRAAIGAGLAEAAHLLAASDPKAAAQIQAAVAASGTVALITAFIAGSSGVQTTSIGGGGGGESGAGSGGQTGGVAGLGGANGGPTSGGVAFGSPNAAPAYGSVGAGGGLTTSTSQSTSPSKSSL